MPEDHSAPLQLSKNTIFSLILFATTLETHEIRLIDINSVCPQSNEFSKISQS
jgi:hypothetical protein